MALDPREGKVLQDRYKILNVLAEGGMGIVYRAERVGIGRPVVVKFLHAVLSDRPGMVDRFEREARATARLNHPNCVALVDFGIEESAPFLVMEYVEGKTLADLLDHGPLQARRAARIVRQVLAGLSHAHERGILHRDLKPANVMIVDVVGWSDLVKILDFGLAKLFGPEPGDGRDVTVQGIAIGTPGYMSPEQASGVPSDRRSDVYCAGALLYHLVTGAKAFTGSDVHEVLRRHREETPVSPRDVRPSLRLSVQLEAVIRRSMERDPGRRFQSADEMSEALLGAPEAAEEGALPAGARPPPLPSLDATRPEGLARGRGRERKRRGSFRALLAAFAVGAVGAVCALVYTPAGSLLAPHLSQVPPPSPPNRAPPPPTHPPLRPAPVAPPPVRAQVAPQVDLAAPPRDLLPPPERPVDLGSPDIGLSEEEPAKADDGESEDPRAQPAQVAAAPIRAMPQVRTLVDVKMLLKKGDADGALSGLYRLREQKPPPSPVRSAEIARIIGHLYFDRHWWTDALKEYRFAVLSDGKSKVDPILIGNVVHTIADGRTYARARVLLVEYIGRAAIPALKKMAKTGATPILRHRAEQVLAAFASKAVPAPPRPRPR